MGRQFVLNHLHGYLGSFEKLISEWRPEEETLVVMGNVLDYGQNAYLVYNRLFALKEEFPEQVVFLKGRHEMLFEKFIKNPMLYAEEFLSEGGMSTLLSFSETGIEFDELTDTYFLVENILPSMDFSLIEMYINECVSFYDTASTVYVSQENKALQEVLEKEWTVEKERKLFLSTGEDERFKSSYISFYFSESLERLNAEDGQIKGHLRTSYVLPSSSSNGQIPATSLNLSPRPDIIGYKVEESTIVRTIQVESEN